MLTTIGFEIARKTEKKIRNFSSKKRSAVKLCKREEIKLTLNSIRSLRTDLAVACKARNSRERLMKEEFAKFLVSSFQDL